MREVLGRDPSRYRTLRDAVAAIRDREKTPYKADVQLRLGVGEVLLGRYTGGLEHLAKAGDVGLAHYHRGIALENLRTALPEQATDPAEADRLVRAMFRHFIRATVELFLLPRKLHLANWRKHLVLPG